MMEGAAATLVQVLLSGLAIGSLYALIALGYSLTFVVNGTVNMSQGQLVMLGGMLTYAFVEIMHVPFYLSFLLAGIVVGLLGIIIERFAIRKFAKDTASVNWVLSTLAIGIIIQDVAHFIWGPNEHVVASPVGEDIVRVLGAGVYWKELILIPVVGVFLIFLTFFYLKSHWGLWLRATADNHTAINLMGINSNYIVAIAYILSGILAGLGGGMMSTIYAVSVAVGLPLGLKAIAVAMVSGLNSAKGIVLTGLGLGISELLVATYVSPNFREMIIYLLVILILFVKPTGLFGTRTVVKV
ncbi:branched-chain amino acid ABC transporter permease [Paenibacillus validus]|nr:MULTISPECIES: branched-chain amino acid ABC transporter permease [Paenibacillus]MED4601236.1 branched-chain amino acid ABC transporter permease [Paenibacillus validus]MED4606796.1 branched-chain amino acid ABC transporter permease [Paenibacillus validus]